MITTIIATTLLTMIVIALAVYLTAVIIYPEKF